MTKPRIRKPAKEDWCILRTAGRSTLALAQSLAEDGFDVWTPVETRIETVPRMNVKRTIRLPIMRSYVFARVAHLVSLLELAAMPVKPRRGPKLHQPAHPSFSVLHAFGRIPLVADGHLLELRKIEARRTPRKIAAYSFPRNHSVRVKEGVFGGLVGVVIRSTPVKTTICFTGGWDTEIPTSLLEQNPVSGDQLDQPERVPRHRNAAKYLGQKLIVGKAFSEKCEACAV